MVGENRDPSYGTRPLPQREGLGQPPLVDENDCGFHEDLLEVVGFVCMAVDWLSQSSKWVSAKPASPPGTRVRSLSLAPK